MTSYLFKLLYLLCYGLVIILTYYFTFDFHKENATGYIAYLLPIFIMYVIYKTVVYISGNDKLEFSPMKIFSYFLMHLFLLCILFFSLNGNPGGLGITLFFKIIGFLIIPTFITITNISFGKYLLSKVKGFDDETTAFKFLFSLGIGFFVFITSLSILGFLGFYNIYSVAGVLVVLLGLSYKNFIETAKGIFSYKFIIENNTSSLRSQTYLFTTEFLFLVITFLISINFINIVRPMPIGWDDLGVYMNYPNLMASSGKILNLGVVAWQTFTGIGYMMGSAAQSFFMNNVGGILSILVLGLSFGDLLKSKLKSFINIPLLSATIFLSMPMVVFQQAKDMKLDTGLFFVSGIVIYLVLYIFLKYVGFTDNYNKESITISNNHSLDQDSVSITKETKNGFFSYFEKHVHLGDNDIFHSKKYLIYLFLIGILAGFAFTIKFTTLLLISSILGIFFYSKIGIAGLIAYFAFYVGIFTKAGLWEMMFVVYPKDDLELKNKIFIYSFLLGLSLIAYCIKKYGFTAFKNLIIIVSLFLIGVGAGASPWFVKNISTLDSKITISGILSGKGDTFNIDYTKIYSKDEVEKINNEYNTALTVSSSGTTTNEDMGRYFGYENGINNYMKLPFNLTMQVNQRGEFTDITYIFLAIIPAIVLFLAYKVELYAIGVFLMSSLPLILHYTKFGEKITNFFTSHTLPEGYVIIALFFLIPFFYLIYSLNKEKISVIFRLNLVFALFYIFLWTISAFGIVWYGVAMYYSLLLIVAIGIYYISSYEDEKNEKEVIFKFLGSIVVFFLISIYFIFSSLPHGLNNLKGASYENYKTGNSDNYTAIFESHSDYYDALVELNLSEKGRVELFNNTLKGITNDKLIGLIKENKINDLIKLNTLLKEINSIEQNDLEISRLKQDAKKIKSELYKNVLYPSIDTKNSDGIYRIGTFLKFFISDNHNRLLDDSMVVDFNKFIYSSGSTDISVDRIKKMGVNYFLVDLNAATIDRDPRHDLTKRYEKLLETFTSDKLELVQTDSICLKIALEDYKKSPKTKEDLDKYIRFAGVNYESYTPSGEVINRGIKQFECYNYILELMKNNKINESNYSYLSPIINYLNQKQITSEKDLINFFRSYVSAGWMVLFKIKN